MQESYISLDPVNAESMTSQQRSRVWTQRIQEANGGQVGEMMGHQMAVTTMLASYTMMRRTGFRVAPLTASKLPGIGGIFLAGVLGWGLGTSYGTVTMGNARQYQYLMQNRSAIVRGDAPFDAQRQ